VEAAAERDFNTAARALLDAALQRETRSYGTVRLSLRAIAASFSAAPEASATLVRRILTDDEVREHGFEQLRDLAELAPVLLERDVELVLDIYRATFSWRDTSDDATPLRTGVLALSSNRRQEYDGARRELAEHFPRLVERSPAGVVGVLVETVRGYLRGRELAAGERQTVTVGGRQIEVFADHSVYWDRADRPRDPEVEMLAAWQRGLTQLAGDEQAIEQVLDAMAAASPLPACLLSHLLAAGTDSAEDLGTPLSDSLTYATALAASDTLVAYGDVLIAVWPTLEDTERIDIEHAIMALPDTFRPDAHEVGEHRRDRLIALLEPSVLMTGAARELSDRLRATGHPIENTPLVGFPNAQFRAVDADDSLRMRRIDPDLRDNRRAVDLSRVLGDWHNARTQADVENPPLAQLIEGLRRLIAALPDLRDSSELNQDLLSEAEGYLAQGGRDLAEHITPETPPQHLDLALEIARSAAGHALPDPSQDDPDRWDGDMPSWGWPSPRVDAASIYLLLSRYPELASSEVLDGLSAAAIDSSAAVRMQVAEYGWWAIRADPERVWGWATTAAEQEPRAAVLHGELVTISHLYPADRDRAVTLAITILQRERAGRASPHLLDALAGLLAEWWIYEERPEGRELLDELLADLSHHLDPATAVAHRLRAAVVFDHPDAQRPALVRARAFSLFAQLVRAACDCFDELLAQEQSEPAQLRAVSQLLDALAAELYFSSGAYDRDGSDGTPPDPARFYAEASVVLDEIVRIGIPHAADYLVRTLSHFVDVDPRGVLRRLHALLGTGERWGLTADSLTENHFMPTVSHLLAAHRDLLMSDPDARANLVGALSTFSRAGSPSARRILYGLDDMFR
jgi:hypothetical protein